MPEGMKDVGLIFADVVAHLVEGSAQLVGIAPLVTEDQDIRAGVRHPGCECVLDSIVNGQTPVVACLGDEAWATTDMDDALAQIDVLGLQLEQLPLAHAGVGGHEDDVGQILALPQLQGGLHHALHLSLGEVGEPVLQLLPAAQLGGCRDQTVERQVVEHRGDGRDDPVDGGVALALLLQLDADLGDGGLVDLGQREAASPKPGEVAGVDPGRDCAIAVAPGVTGAEGVVNSLAPGLDGVRHR